MEALDRSISSSDEDSDHTDHEGSSYDGSSDDDSAYIKEVREHANANGMAINPIYTVWTIEANKRFFIHDSKSENNNALSSLSQNCDDKNGHLLFNVGDCLLSRYTICRQLGQGGSAKIVECWDGEKGEMVAIKIVRNKPVVHKFNAGMEIMLLTHITMKEDYGPYCVQMRNWFCYRGHLCIVFEKLGPCLYSFSQKTNFAPLSIYLVRELGRQLLECVAFLHYMGIIHTDLKYHNILLISEEFGEMLAQKILSQTPKAVAELFKSSAIKLIDFNAARFNEDEELTYKVSPRPHRAPEIILGLEWKFPCDVWSVGCILVELCMGREKLFNAKGDLEHLAMMKRFLGHQLPHHMLQGAKYNEKFVMDLLNWPEGAKGTCFERVEKIPRIQDVVLQHAGPLGSDFLNLLEGLCKYDPSDRLTAQAALCHPFFTG